MVDDREDQSGSIKEDRRKSAVVGDHVKLWTKLRLPKDEEQAGVEEDQTAGYQWEDQEQLPNNTGTLTRFCHVCNKGFRSGKALGGHMRIHIQGHREPVFIKKLKPSQSIKFNKRKDGEVTDVVKKKISNKSANGGATTGFNEIPTCLCCGKNFPSMKSLFGHMRCHPGRDWRGIHPPPGVKTGFSSSVSDSEPQKSDDQVNLAASHWDGDQAADLTKSLRGWPATSKRGRNTNSGNSSRSCSEEEEKLRIARELMRLAHGDSFGSGLTNKQKVEEFEATNSNSPTYKAETEDKKKLVSGSRKRSFEETSVGYKKDHPVKQLRNEGRYFSYDGKTNGFQLNGGIRMGDVKAAHETGFLAGKSVTVDSEMEDTNRAKEYEVKNCSTDYESDSKNTEQLNHKNCESTNGKVIIAKKRKKMKLRDLDSVHRASPVHQNPVVLTMIATPDKFRCSTCDKCFPTHQALGGHKSSHNKFRMVIQNAVDERTYAADEHDNLAHNSPITMDETKECEGAASSKQMDGTHQCKICNRNFSKGQALGGHKRCRWNGPMEAQSSQVTSQSEVSRTGGKVFYFDLNEVPPPEDDAVIESEHVAGCDPASSSYTSVEFSSL